MNREFLRREWGAVSFLVVTALGMVVVPVGLNLNRHPVSTTGSTLVSLPPSESASPAATPSPSASPSAAASASPSAAASASPSAGAGPSPSSSAAAPSP